MDRREKAWSSEDEGATVYLNHQPLVHTFEKYECVWHPAMDGGRVALDKDEGFVKGKVIVGGARAPLFCASAREVLWK